MANLGPMGSSRQTGLPTPPKGDPIAKYSTYLDAQRAVDFLSDNNFPVQYVTIVGSGLRMVERVTGRLTYPRVAIAGAASGAWFGLFVGLLLSLFGSGAQGGLVAALLIGSAFGILFGVTSYAFTRGRRDFTSTSQIVASEYEVLCMPEHKQAALELLSKLPEVGDASVNRSVPTHDLNGSAASGNPYQRPPSGSGPAAGSTGQPIGSTTPEHDLIWSEPPRDLPPPSGSPSPGVAPSGQIAPNGDSTAVEPAIPPAPREQVTYGEMIERKRREEAKRQAEEWGEQQS